MAQSNNFCLEHENGLALLIKSYKEIRRIGFGNVLVIFFPGGFLKTLKPFENGMKKKNIALLSWKLM